MFSNSGGTMAPASMLPTGTPVCLMEKTSDIRCGGVVRASTCELAGVIGPYPRPINTAPKAMAGSQGKLHSSKPQAHSNRPHWLTRMAPRRRTVSPPSRLAVIAPA
mgnify:CR=1 FL=1